MYDQTQLRENVKRVFSLFSIYTISNMTKQRLGSEKGDGGYVVLRQLIEKAPCLLSFGIGDNVDFEMDWIKESRGETVYMFDPFCVLPKISDIQLKPYCEFSQEAFPTPLQKSKVPLNAALKVDVEGDEWEGLHSISSRTLKRFSQIMCEFHIFPILQPTGFSPYFSQVLRRFYGNFNTALFDTYREVLEKLSNDFVCFHTHANNSLTYMNIEGVEFPPLLETSWVRKDLVPDRLQLYEGRLPIEGLDVPNKSDRPDFADWRQYVID